MPSLALQDWLGPRSARLDELEDAHRTIGGEGPGRRYRTQQINWALILRVAGEFQGFARDLHDEATDFVVSEVAGASPAGSQLLRGALTLNRRLDKGNPDPSALSEDFGRFGIDLWPALQATDPYTRGRQNYLTLIMRARNAIAHDDQNRFASLAAEGHRLNLRTARRGRNALGHLAQTLDACLADHLEELFTTPPWQ